MATVSFFDFINNISSDLPFLITSLLTFAVILVNGWTDAPNAIATCVSTRSLAPKNAIILAAIFNFLGVTVMTVINSGVAVTMTNIAEFDSGGSYSLIALCAAMFAIVIWATVCWIFGIPTSESHALIAGISGAAVALNGGIGGINFSEWQKVLWGLLLSTILGYVMGYLTVKLVEFIFRRADRKRTSGIFSKAQTCAAAATAFMHGAQDGQKFMGVFMLGIFLSNDIPLQNQFTIPIWMMIVCSALMALGTSLGGLRIIKSVGMDMVKLETYQGFSADIAAAGCLLVSSIFGIPVSTTHTKTTAIMGVGSARRISSVNWNIVKEMVLAWLLTFPGCAAIGYIIATVFIHIF